MAFYIRATNTKRNTISDTQIEGVWIVKNTQNQSMILFVLRSVHKNTRTFFRVEIKVSQIKHNYLLQAEEYGNTFSSSSQKPEIIDGNATKYIHNFPETLTFAEIFRIQW